MANHTDWPSRLCMEPFARLWQRRRRLGRVDAMTAKWFQLSLDDVVVTIHCGSRGLGHQIGTEFLKEMVLTAKLQASSSSTGARLRPDQLGGRRPLPRRHARSNQLRAGKPQILGHYARRVFAHFFPDCDLRLLFDVSHNTCKVEMRAMGGRDRTRPQRSLSFIPARGFSSSRAVTPPGRPARAYGRKPCRGLASPCRS